MAIRVSSRQEWDIEGITSEIEQPGLQAVIYFFSPALEQYKPHKALSDAFPQAVCIGASMIGGWSTRGAVEQGITAMSLSDNEVEAVYVSFAEGVKEDPARAARTAIVDLKNQTRGENINPDEYLGLIFFDGLCLGELIIKEFSLEQSLNMAFVGGAAADELTFTKTLVGVNKDLSDDALAAVILKMKIPFFFNHYVHYLPTETAFTITRVEIMKRIAWEIDGEPAARFYARKVGIDDVTKLNAAVFAKHPLGLRFGESVYVRSPNAVIDGRGLQFYCYIEAGTKVHLLRQGDIIAHARQSLEETSEFLQGQGCLLFNCVLRYLELKETGNIDAFNRVFSGSPMIGFNTYGEELFTHHNQTLTAVFFGNPPAQGEADPYKAKRLFHYTDSKLKSLVFDIVSRSELLNITISYLKGNMDNASGEGADFQLLKKSLDAMVKQANVSKEDIEQLLVVYQNNVEQTGKYVFNIVDEIRAQNQRLQELREKAETANRTKSDFLANISHEIRTPMNAITGMAELLLRGSLSDEERGYVRDIKQAGANLISIINDLLDFSKIEAGKLEILSGPYMLSSLINDTVSIIRMRLMEKPIRFFTNIDSRIPNSLIGDEVRLRQILLNLLSNAVKYTDRGCISASIIGERRETESCETAEKGQVRLKITVADTGRGIKPEDREKLFGEFAQFDTRKNRSIEGTGLGLAITKRLCLAMGGDITVESEYGKGTSFTAIIPQGIADEAPFALVEKSGTKKVLIYEGRSVYAKSVQWSLANMWVPHVLVQNEIDFADALFSEEWYFVFSGYGLYERIRKVMERPESDFKGGKKPPLALMVEWGTETYIPGVRFVSLPVQTLSIADILNGKTGGRGYYDNTADYAGARFVIPGARLLVVDDISTNLKVAEGLLAPYKAEVHTASSGAESVELAKRTKYDIIFMDHMMPEMDGIEAAAAIRTWEMRSEEGDSPHRQVPIIALTANAVSGMKEMFIEKGFNDFLAKPIDISKLDEALAHWIPKKKQVKTNSERHKADNGGEPGIVIPGVDVQHGISMTGGTEVLYRKVLASFYRDAFDRLPLLEKTPEEAGLPLFITQVHALKSASASIGAAELSAGAAALEAAGKAGDFDTIRKGLPDFYGRLKETAENIKRAVESAGEEGGMADNNGAKELKHEFLALSNALEQKELEAVDRILSAIEGKSMDAKTAAIVTGVSDAVLMADFEKALENLKEVF